LLAYTWTASWNLREEQKLGDVQHLWALVMLGISAIITTFGICGFSLVESAEDGRSSQEDSWSAGNTQLAVSPSGKQIAI
jgi:hypothetical protein